jgi:hypothetical protein
MKSVIRIRRPAPINPDRRHDLRSRSETVHMTDTQRSLNAAMRKQVSAGRTDRQSADSVQGAYYAVLLVAVPSWESAPDPASNPADAMSFFTSVSPGRLSTASTVV